MIRVMLGVDCGLDIVADDTAAPPAGRHGPRIRVRQRHLLVRRGLHDRFKGFERRHLLAKRGDLLLQTHGFGLRQLALLPVRRLQGGQVARDAGLDPMAHPLLQLRLW